MKIVYMINYDINENKGVIHKIKQNAVQWTLKGHVVYFVSLKTMAIYDSEYQILFQEKFLDIKYGRLGTAINLLYSYYHLSNLIDKIEFDLIYMRYQLYMPFITKILKRNTVVMEINGDDTVEYKLSSKLTHFYNKLTRRFILKHANAFVSVSYELKEKFSYLKKPIIVIANGIDTKLYVPQAVSNKQPILVFISTPNQPWQGVDKILSMANYFKDYIFYIIGLDGISKDNIKYFGYMSNEESSNIINKCDVGIGTLSLYKQGLKEASPLKTRQYLACGIPIIYAYKDTDVPPDAPFALELENKENNMDYDKIKNFVDYVFENKNMRSEARRFAEEKLDYKKKEQKRLDFFQKVLNGKTE